MTEIIKSIQWTTVASSAIVAAVVGVTVGVFQLIATRYTNRILDHIESILRIRRKEGNGDGANKEQRKQ